MYFLKFLIKKHLIISPFNLSVIPAQILTLQGKQNESFCS